MRGYRTARHSLITLADRAREAGQWDIAARYYRKSLDRNPRKSPIWVQYGHALKESGHLAEAEAAYRQALASEPETADSHIQLGHVLKLQGKVEEAKAAYLRALMSSRRAIEPVLRELADLGCAESELAEASGGTLVFPQTTPIINPIATLDIGCGRPLQMLSIERDDDVVDVYRTTGCFEPASLMVWFDLAKQSSYALDVGAYTGIYALTAAAANRAIKVAAIEPARQQFSRLCMNIRINELQAQIAPLNFAAGDRCDDGLLNHYDYLYCLNSGSTLLENGVRPFRYSEAVRMLPLDNLSELATTIAPLLEMELPQTDPDLVKIDVEGYESKVISGMRRAIRRSRPIFIIECLSLEILREVQICLSEFSYNPLLIDDENMSLIGNIYEYRVETTRNVLLYPPDKRSLIQRFHDNNSRIAVRH